MVAEFDRIADVYDDTRPALHETELRIIEDELRMRECHFILEIGVGTGRVAKPLSEVSFDMVGVDLSTGMISRAKQKGLEKLVIADAYSLPFMDDVFDAAILVHVVHLLPDPVIALAEIGRVVRRSVVAIVRHPNGTPDECEQLLRVIRQRVAREGHSRLAEDHWKKETELLQSVSPMERRPFCDRTTEMTVDEIISIFKKRAYRFALNLSAEELDKIAREITLQMKGKTVTRRRTEDIVVWGADQLKGSR
jgi:ubiquinone/menaquinone biosynthesis C-methylase UbiE